MQPSVSYSQNFQLAADFVNHTAQHIFLTGKAGTGKTTFLKFMKDTCKKNMAIAAPTGVAAINCGGVTLHSLFQLPMGMYIPGTAKGFLHSEIQITDKHSLFRNLRMSNDKIKLFKSLELLVIDEVSMLRCDLLDAIDALLRRYRKNFFEPFGGVQVLFIGDLFQLPPVVKDDEWILLKEYYASPFFYDAQALVQQKPLCIELDKIYRQNDDIFIQLLNRIRNNEVIRDDYELLHRHYQPDFTNKPGTNYIILTTHNRKADEINYLELNKLHGHTQKFEARVSQDFPERLYPVDKTLLLKEGAQIMFTKNDKEKRYFNGKIGIVEKLSPPDEEEQTIEIRFPEGGENIIILQETWKNIRYTLNQTNNKIEEEELGSFTQYPLRLAWAITIHKSQGLTFERAVIDASLAFAPGQVYVALSRCTTLGGIILMSRISQNAIHTDERIVNYMRDKERTETLPLVLEEKKAQYLINQTIQLYDLQETKHEVEVFMQFIEEKKLETKEEILDKIQQILDNIKQLKNFADKFIIEIKRITADGLTEEVKAQLQTRKSKANAYFEKQLNEIVISPFKNLNTEIQKKHKVRQVLKAMGEMLDYFKTLVSRFASGEVKMKPGQAIFMPAKAPLETAQTATALSAVLKQVRRQLAEAENIPPYRICSDSAIHELVTYLPHDITEMARIKGMGDYTLGKYGEAFLQQVVDYASKNNLQSNIQAKPGKQKNKSKEKNEPFIDSKTQSLVLYQQGKTIPEIAALRNYAISTIEGHLAHFIHTGTLNIDQFVPSEKYKAIAAAIHTAVEPGFNALKNVLGSDITYSEIRYVFNDLERIKQLAS